MLFCVRFANIYQLWGKMPTAAVNSTAALTQPRKRLLFDRRYGWVLDEWKEPSEEALSGGRGMFCIAPLAKALLQKASESIYFVGSSTLNALQRPEVFSPKAVQATLSNQMNSVLYTVKTADLVSMAPRRINTKKSASLSSDLPEGNTDELHTESNPSTGNY